MANILVIGKYYPPFEGGIETYTRDVCEMLASRHQVVAVVYNHEHGRREELINGVRVIRCSRQGNIRGQPIAFGMVSAIALEDVDLVHFHAPNFFSNAILLLKMMACKRHIPVVVTHHMEVYGRRLLRRLAMPFYRNLVRRSAAVIVTSEKNAALSADLPANASTVAIPLGIDPEEFVLSDSERAAARVWKRRMAGDSRTVAFIGRHARYKGLAVLTRATAQIPGVHALIAGEGPYQASARELAAALGVADRVHFLGPISKQQKKFLLGACDVFALPSTEITEAFGVSLLEAMAAGIPIVASDLPTGVSDLAIGGETALVAPPGDARALAGCIKRVLSDPGLADRLRDRARKLVVERFSKASVLEQTRDLIERHLPDYAPSASVDGAPRAERIPARERVSAREMEEV